MGWDGEGGGDVIVTYLGMHYGHNNAVIYAGLPLDQGSGTDPLPLLFMYWGLSFK